MKEEFGYQGPGGFWCILEKRSEQIGPLVQDRDQTIVRFIERFYARITLRV